MTEQELKIENLQAAIKVLEKSIEKGNNPRVRRQDKEALARLKVELLEEQTKSATASFQDTDTDAYMDMVRGRDEEIKSEEQ